jgi:hypothetical protein
MPLPKALEIRADVFGFMWDKAFLLDLFFMTMAYSASLLPTADGCTGRRW